MSVIEEKIRLEMDGSLSFGNYKSEAKQKLEGFEAYGDLYKVKTHDGVTRLEKNAKLLFESIPGTSVHHLKVTEKVVLFTVEGFEDTQITMELEPEREYRFFVDGMNVGSMKSNFSGKISFSVDLTEKAQDVKIERV